MGRRAGPGGVGGTRGDLQLTADRLHPEDVLVGVDVIDDQPCRRSSSAAKKADVLLTIAFDRRSSRFSRSTWPAAARPTWWFRGVLRRRPRPLRRSSATS